jgi:ABC-type glycerol-3-phosphate transport system permease component
MSAFISGTRIQTSTVPTADSHPQGPSCWPALAILGVIDFVWMWHDSIEITPRSLTRTTLTLTFLAGAAWLLRRGRPNFVKISAARTVGGMAQICALMMVVAPFDYLIESLRMPLVDDSLRGR